MCHQKGYKNIFRLYIIDDGLGASNLLWSPSIGVFGFSSLPLHAGVVLGAAGRLRPVDALILVFRLLLARLQDLEGAHEGLVHRHHAARVIELAAVVRCREKGDQLPLGEEFVSVLHHLEG